MENIDITKGLVSEIKQLMETSKSKVAVTINSEMSWLYWTIGNKIKAILDNTNGSIYGKNLVASIAAELVVEYGSSLSEKNLRRMIQFASVFPDQKIVVSLIRQLSWTHILAVIPIEDTIKRDFYI